MAADNIAIAVAKRAVCLGLASEEDVFASIFFLTRQR
jgi:hypothetical protein